MRGPPTPSEYYVGICRRFSGEENSSIALTILRFLLNEQFIGFAFQREHKI